MAQIARSAINFSTCVELLTFHLEFIPAIRNLIISYDFIGYTIWKFGYLENHVFSHKDYIHMKAWSSLRPNMYLSDLSITFDAAAQNVQTPTRLTYFPGKLSGLEIRNVSTLRILVIPPQCEGICLYCVLWQGPMGVDDYACQSLALTSGQLVTYCKSTQRSLHQIHERWHTTRKNKFESSPWR